MRKKLATGVGLVAALALAAIVAVWLMWFPPWATPLDKRLVGRWEGAGQVSGDWSLDIKPNPEHDVPGGKSSGRVTSVATVQAEFKPDGTYTWKEHHSGGGFEMNVWFPIDDATPARWEMVSSHGNKLVVRMHFGEAVLDFQGENSFSINLPESAGARGTYSFQRSSKSERATAKIPIDPPKLDK